MEPATVEDNEGTLSKLERVVPLAVVGTCEGIADAARDAWHHPGKPALEFGLAAGVGAVLSNLQVEAALPKLGIELGLVALAAASAKSIFEQSTKGFSALGDAWNSPLNAQADRQEVAAVFGKVAFDTALMTLGGMTGATLTATVPVALKERGIINEMRNYHPESAEHSVRVSKYTELSAKELGLSFGEQREATHAALMHDTGKLDMPIEVLGKTNGALTEQDWLIMHQHPVNTFERLQEVPYKGILRNVPEDAMQHHEWINGAGYPNHLTGDQMRIAAKEVPPADVFDAVTSGRAYMHGGRMPLGEVKQLIDGASGTHFEPAAVESLWNIPADKAIAVLESAPNRVPPPVTVLGQFKHTTLGRLLDVLNGAPSTNAETHMANLLNSIYTQSRLAA